MREVIVLKLMYRIEVKKIIEFILILPKTVPWFMYVLSWGLYYNFDNYQFSKLKKWIPKIPKNGIF